MSLCFACLLAGRRSWEYMLDCEVLPWVTDGLERAGLHADYCLRSIVSLGACRVMSADLFVRVVWPPHSEDIQVACCCILVLTFPFPPLTQLPGDWPAWR